MNKLDSGKPRVDLIRPEFILELGKTLGYGANKYNESVGDIPNYLKNDGFHYSRLTAAMERHLLQFKMGVDIDDENGELYHIIQVAANAMMLHSYLVSGKGIDDRINLKKLRESENTQGTKKEGL